MKSLLLRMDEVTKRKLFLLAKKEHRSMNSLVVSLLDRRLRGTEPAEVKDEAAV